MTATTPGAASAAIAALDALRTRPALARNGEPLPWESCYGAQELAADPTKDLSSTPAGRWRVEGDPDPHGNTYECERAVLCQGNLTDDEIANAVYLDPSIGNLTAAKERIRWLSRKLVAATASPGTVGKEGPA